jgi:hypothetical protein
MRWFMIAAAVLMVTGVAGAAEAPAPATVRLQLRNEAQVSDDVLEESRNEVARIFARAGFAVLWVDEAPGITVKIVAHVIGYARAESPVMGVALRTADGPIAQVFFRRVEEFARIHRADLSMMLGHVMAHEVGHLLMPALAHSPTGLMRGVWDKAQVREATGGALTFTTGQAERIRAARR